jgi:hypothetical protein
MSPRLFALINAMACLIGTSWAATNDLSSLTSLSPGGASPLSGVISGKARVWIFLSAKCPCSDSHIDKLKKTARLFSPQGFEFIGVHANQDEEEFLARAYFKNADLGFPVYHDSRAQLADHFGALKTPHVFVEGPDHKILYEGGIDDSKQASSTDKNFLRDALLEIQSGREVSRLRTRSLGCVISRKAKS